MELSGNKLLRDPLFAWGLAVRLAMLVLLVPTIQTNWFIPFLDGFLRSPGLDPWSTHLQSGGDPLAYPYGPVMFLWHLPGAALGALLGWLLNSPSLTGVGFRLSLLLADFVILMLLARIFPDARRKLLCLYWWSPLVLYATYLNGQTDVVPVALLLMGFMWLRSLRPAWSGTAIALAMAAKLSIGAAIPFVVIYYWRNKRLGRHRYRFALSLILASAAVHAPFLFSPGFLSMVLGNRETQRLFDLALNFGGELRLYVTPATYSLALYAAWRLSRMSFELLFSVTGLAFFLMVLLTSAPAGWYVWLVPFLVAHQLGADRSSVVLVGIFSAAVISYHLLYSQGAQLVITGAHTEALGQAIRDILPARGQSIWATGITTIGAILAIQIVREGIRRNDYYRLSRKPIALGIAGDSGSGKDTLSIAIAALFGEHSVVHISGDDYHRWDRNAPMWRGLTHLNPRANDLYRFTNDTQTILDGRAVVCRRYDHSIGRFGPPTPLESNDVVIVSGLHALHPLALRERYDVTIYLDMSEELRRFWKIQRDVHVRGHSLQEVLGTFKRRETDAGRYVHPQKIGAQLVFSLMPVNPQQLNVDYRIEKVALKLMVRIDNGLYHEQLARTLIGVCGLMLDLNPTDDPGAVEMTIEGEVVSEDISLAASQHLSKMQDFLDIEPEWADGMTGLMQLITLMHLDQALRTRAR